MSGTKSSGRPGGNPDLKKYWFKTDRAEPLREHLQLKVSASMKKKIYEKEHWQEFVRKAIAKALEEDPSKSA